MRLQANEEKDSWSSIRRSQRTREAFELVEQG